MQGTYRNNGLPRPYYMKPNSKKKSPYDSINSPSNIFNNPRRKILGYLFLLGMIGTILFWVSQDLRPQPPKVYEIIKDPVQASVNNIKNDHPNIDKIANSVGSKADKESDNVDLAGNLAQGSKGEKGVGVVEAPKGGMANEAPLVGTDEEKLVGTGKKPSPKNVAGVPPKDTAKTPSKGYKADKASEEAAPVADLKDKFKDNAKKIADLSKDT